MYLSKVWLQPKCLDNTWEWHRAIWTLFPGIERQLNEPSPFLFRVENLHLSRGAELLMTSSVKPEMESGKARVLAIKEVTQQLNQEQLLHFMLTANVTKKIVTGDEPERKIRVPLLQEDEQLNWLERKLGGAASFVKGDIRLQGHPPTYFRKGNRPGKIVSVTFEGVLRVIEPNQLKVLLNSGIGPAKAFGCGLLLVRRI